MSPILAYTLLAFCILEVAAAFILGRKLFKRLTFLEHTDKWLAHSLEKHMHQIAELDERLKAIEDQHQLTVRESRFSSVPLQAVLDSSTVRDAMSLNEKAWEAVSKIDDLQVLVNEMEQTAWTYLQLTPIKDGWDVVVNNWPTTGTGVAMTGVTIQDALRNLADAMDDQEEEDAEIEAEIAAKREKRADFAKRVDARLQVQDAKLGLDQSPTVKLTHNLKVTGPFIGADGASKYVGQDANQVPEGLSLYSRGACGKDGVKE